VSAPGPGDAGGDEGADAAARALAPLSGTAVVAAYLLALVTLLAPLAVLGAVFAGIVLMRREHPGHGVAVIALGAVCVVLGMTVVWT
jgi:hypothetical protein